MTQICDQCRSRMFTVRKSPHPTLWPKKVLTIYECPQCLRRRKCTENGEVECVNIEP
jgi:hypothetical protein